MCYLGTFLKSISTVPENSLYNSTTFATTDEATENTDTTEEGTEGTTEDSTVDSTEETDNTGEDSGEILECENPNPEVITIGNGTILQAYCDEGSLNGTR